MANFTIGEEVSIDNIPDYRPGKTSDMQEVFNQLLKLEKGKVLPITFTNLSKAKNARAAIRRIGKRKKKFVSTCKGSSLTVYMWIEPEENLNL